MNNNYNISQVTNRYLNSGLSIIPTDVVTKQPLFKWKPYQKLLPTVEEIAKWWIDVDRAVALICGIVSGCLEIIDIDNHFGDAEQLFNSFKELVENTDSALWAKLTIENTQSGGFHLIYRCPSGVEGNTKLASRINPEGRPETLIETRGEGGYALVAPSKNYNLIQGKISDIQNISADDRELLLSIARSFNEVIEEKAIQSIAQTIAEAEKPGTAFNERGDIKALLIAHGWTFSHNVGDVQYWIRPGKTSGVSASFNCPKLSDNKFYVFSSNAAPFEQGKSYDKFAVLAKLEFNDDFSACAKDLLAKGYGTPKNGKLNGTAGTPVTTTKQKSKTNKSVTSGGDVVPTVIEFDFPDNCVFWFEYTNAKGEQKLNISKAKFINYLEHYGFFKFWIDKNISIYVREQNHIISEETPETILDFLKKQIASLSYNVSEHMTRFDLWEIVLQKIGVMNSRDFLSTLTPKDIKFLDDEKDDVYFCFKSSIVHVTGKKVEVLSYEDLDCYVWKNQIIDHNLTLLSHEDGADSSSCLFGRFLEKVCTRKMNETQDDRSLRILDSERLFSLLTGIGYLLHTYKDPAVTKAVIFCEERIARDEESNGRTGKGLTAYAVSKMRQRVMFNGKQLDFRDKFLFQKISPDTQLIYFDDVKKNFDFESLFSILTEGISVERKGQHPIEIPFNKSPKVLISTNAVLSNDADSHKARKFEIEFSDYFTADYSPVDEFHTNFFEKGWAENDPEWDRFYSFMVYCSQLFLQEGLVQYKQINLAERKLMANVPEEFLEFSEEYVEMISNGGKIYKEEIYEKFVEAYKIYGPNGRYATSQKNSTKWFNYILKYKKMDVVEYRGSSRTDRRYYWSLRRNDVSVF